MNGHTHTQNTVRRTRSAASTVVTTERASNSCSRLTNDRLRLATDRRTVGYLRDLSGQKSIFEKSTEVEHKVT